MAKRSYEDWLIKKKYENDPLLDEKDKVYYRQKRADLVEEKMFRMERLMKSLVGKAIKTKKEKDILRAEEMLEKGSRNDWL
jgi:hypothetical protein